MKKSHKKTLLVVLKKILADTENTIIYNGSNNLVMHKKIKDDFNSLGVWFSSSEDYASQLGKVRKFKLNDGNFLDADGRRDILKFLYYSEVYEKMFGKEANMLAQSMYFGKKLDPSMLKYEKKALQKLSSVTCPQADIESKIRASIGFHAPYLEAVKKYLMAKGFDGLHFPKETPLDGQQHEAWLIFEPVNIVEQQSKNNY
jgi:hypothetical protein